MIILDDFEQGSPEWFKAREGIPTASRMSDIITAKTGKMSATSRKYMFELIADRMGAGDPQREPTEWMTRGIELEPEARQMFEFEGGRKVRQVGICLTDDRQASCSPDGLVADGGLEIKCPKGSTHVAYLLNNKLPDTYKQQVHASMAITGLDQWWFMSYHPGADPLYVLVKRDEYTDKVSQVLTEFIQSLNTNAAKLGCMEMAA